MKPPPKQKRLLLSKMRLQAEKLKEMVHIAFGTIRTGSTETLEPGKVLSKRTPQASSAKRDQKCQPKP